MAYFIPALIGFVAGYFFATPVLIFITVISVLFLIYIEKDAKEMAALGLFLCIVVLLISNVAMWVTWIAVSDHAWLTKFLHSLLR